MESVLRSYSSNVFLTRIWVPFICIVFVIGVFGKEFPGWRFLPACPSLLAALFALSTSTLEVRGGVIRYRRLIKWKLIIPEEILECRVEVPNMIGSLRLKRFVWPWGRLYFVLDRNLNPNPFRSGDHPLVNYLRKEPVLRDKLPSKASLGNDHTLKVKLVSAAILGGIVCLLWLILAPKPTPTSVLEKPFDPGKPVAWVTLTVRALHFLNTFPVIAVLFGMFLFLAIYRWRRQDAWTFAFLAGAALASMVFSWLAK